MKDIIQRLRWYAANTTMLSARPILAEAADAIERLRLTQAEREAIESTIWDCDQSDAEECKREALVLRGLLQRNGGEA